MPSACVVFNGHSGTTYLQALQGIHGRELTIASAFGVSHQQIDLLRALARQNRKVTFIVGTQNGFTSPDFIEAGRKLALQLPTLDFIVDFRISDSLHHKWALASPGTVIIGSSNFTRKGLDGACDLMAELNDKSLYRRIQAELARIRRINGVFAASDAEFAAAQKRYKVVAEKLSDIELKKVAVKSKANPYATSTELPSLTEWLNSDAAASLRIFGYERHLDREERRAAAKFSKEALSHGVTLKGATAYCPTRVFKGPFLDVDGTQPGHRTVHPAEVVIANKVDGIGLVLARRLPWKHFGFKMSSTEARLIAAVAVKKCEGRLSVSTMRKVLKPLTDGDVS